MSESNKNNLLNGIGGAALGGLISLLLSLSNAAVVSSTLTVLLSAAVVFFALQDKISIDRADAMTPALLYRIIGFAGAGIVALLIGLQLRASNSFGDSENVRLYHDLIEIGVEEKDARNLVLERLKGTVASTETEGERLVRSTTLFTSEASGATCSNLDPSLFSDLESLLVRYKAEGGEWQIIANTVSDALSAKSEIDGGDLVRGLYFSYCAEHVR